MNDQRFFLFIGNSDTDASTSRLKASSVFYRKKRLESRIENWGKIIELLRDETIIGAVVKLTSSNYRQMVSAGWETTTEQLFAALGRVRHVVLVHESILTGESDRFSVEPTSVEPTLPSEDDDEGDFYWDQYLSDMLAPPPPETRQTVAALFQRHAINVLPYKRNAELSILASSFIEDNEKNLLFRLYIPAGRLWAGEADRLLRLFRDWLTKVKNQRVRQDGYSTSQGQVYEFFGDEHISRELVTSEFAEFSRFLDLCIDHPYEANALLRRLGMPESLAPAMVTRYKKEVSRLRLDLAHEEENRLISIRQRLESEVLEASHDGETSIIELERAARVIAPQVNDYSTILGLPVSGAAVSAVDARTININQQIIGHVEGTVVRDLQGTLHMGIEPRQLLDLIDRLGGDQSQDLRSAVHELEDTDARYGDRLKARQKIKAFLIGASGHVGQATLDVLKQYVESKISS